MQLGRAYVLSKSAQEGGLSEQISAENQSHASGRGMLGHAHASRGVNTRGGMLAGLAADFGGEAGKALGPFVQMAPMLLRALPGGEKAAEFLMKPVQFAPGNPTLADQQRRQMQQLFQQNYQYLGQRLAKAATGAADAVPADIKLMESMPGLKEIAGKMAGVLDNPQGHMFLGMTVGMFSPLMPELQSYLQAMDPNIIVDPMPLYNAAVAKYGPNVTPQQISSTYNNFTQLQQSGKLTQFASSSLPVFEGLHVEKGGRVTEQDLVNMSRNVQRLIDIGVPGGQAMEVISSYGSRRADAAVKDIEKLYTYAQAAGENVGDFSKTLQGLASQGALNPTGMQQIAMQFGARLSARNMGLDSSQQQAFAARAGKTYKGLLSSRTGQILTEHMQAGNKQLASRAVRALNSGDTNDFNYVMKFLEKQRIYAPNLELDPSKLTTSLTSEGAQALGQQQAMQYAQRMGPKAVQAMRSKEYQTGTMTGDYSELHRRFGQVSPLLLNQDLGTAYAMKGFKLPEMPKKGIPMPQLPGAGNAAAVYP